MESFAHKKDLILAREETFADAVAVSVLDKPKVSLWMILIPLLFVYFVYRQQRFTSGRRQFTEDFIKTHRRTLEAACRALESGEPPDIEKIAQSSTIPTAVKPVYKSWVQVLVDHYTDLLQADGNTFDALVRSAYADRTSFLLALNQLSRAEKDLYAALKPHLNQTTEGTGEIITAIEHHCRRLRREMAETIFP